MGSQLTLDTLEWSSDHPGAAGTRSRRPMLRREIPQPVMLDEQRHSAAGGCGADGFGGGRQRGRRCGPGLSRAAPTTLKALIASAGSTPQVQWVGGGWIIAAADAAHVTRARASTASECVAGVRKCVRANQSRHF
jgi:hypothetical protein